MSETSKLTSSGLTSEWPLLYTDSMEVLCTNQQLKDMGRFLTDPSQHTVMGIGDFNVTPIAFRYLLLEHRNEGHSKELQDTSLPALDVSVEDSQIQSLPIAVLQGTWHKAAELLSKPGLVMDAPTVSSNSRCFVVASNSSQRP